MKRSTLGLAAAGLVLLTPLAACTDNAKKESADAGGITVESTNTECNLSATTAPSGAITFNVTNKGDQVTEFYLLGEDGLRIIGEVENVGPGITRDLVVTASPGTYETACKPGMVGDGIRAPFTVTDSGSDTAPSAEVAALIDTATSQYAAYVRDQTEQLLTKTTAFAAAYKAGDDDAARAQFAPARQHWERIEPVAESFGDIDPRTDTREADLEEGQQWTGWHAIEKDLWPQDAVDYAALTTEQRNALADQLVADTQELYDKTRTITFTPDQLGNGAKELLDEVANGKITGEEDIWSHTDLWDFQGNVDGARVAFEDLEPVLKVKNPELATTLTDRFADLQSELDLYKVGDGFVLYTDLTPDQIKTLSDKVNALSEPLSQMTSAVVL